MQLARESAVERVRRELEYEINNGIRPPGEPLDETELMERFKVSRTPVRTAILQLASHGLIAIIPRSGTYVARMSPQELLSMLEVLAEMEAASAKLATRRMRTEDRQKLKALHAEAEAIAVSEDSAAYERYNAEWHGMIYAASLNAYLTEQILSIRRRTKVYRRSVFQEQGRIKTSYSDHGKIVEAILAGNAEEAYRHMHEHISGSSKDFLELLARIPGLMADDQATPKRAVKRK
ncbi:GntR family transcriptional regulator [Noviherbaspirillum saxi]|uniref:GntR family transcriptional regulator n=1 Tax=Noviherbaspirillum saxi TaxID=2320863 RepID=A0A3A3FNZ6_9BURK|nr:GntR family transcriptional regulator [Noviherbaspirillum saxi]RJF96215.1 GntR family transcriptional regulator [Noviherbaspirillum saxi]